MTSNFPKKKDMTSNLGRYIFADEPGSHVGQPELYQVSKEQYYWAWGQIQALGTATGLGWYIARNACGRHA
jgi:hypothetical protein